MSRSHSLTSIDVSEYDRIETAMSESARGRWFLDEYARRTRGEDTQTVLGAIARLEAVVTHERDGSRVGRMRGDLLDMANAIARTKAEIAALGTPDLENSRLGSASVALDAIVRSTERATSDILSAAEDVQEAAWTLRESGSDPTLCDALDQRATEIYTACSFQDLTAQRTARIIHTLRYLEERVAAMMAIWGDTLDTVPPAPGEATAAAPIDLSQSDVDRFIDEPSPMAAASAGRVEPDSVPEGIVPVLPSGDAVDGFDPAQESDSQESDLLESASQGSDTDEPVADGESGMEEPPKTDIAAAFADIDRLSDEEKRALFS